MNETQSLEAASKQLGRARSTYLTSQVSTLDLIDLSEREATLLDKPQSRARRLAELLGVPSLSKELALGLYNAMKLVGDEAKRGRDDKDRDQDAADQSGADEPIAATADEPKKEAELDDSEKKFYDAYVAATKALKATGLPSEAFFSAFRKVARLEKERSRSELMLESLFISSVSQFEAFILRVISTSLQFDPSPLRQSERKFEYKEVADLPDMDSFVKVAVDAYADSIMRESMQKWMAFLARATRTDTDWMADELAEPIMRRHVHVHFAGRVSPQYLESVGKASSLKVNDSLPITRTYLEDALDRMAVVAVSLTQAALEAVANSKKAKQQEWDHKDEGIIEVTYDLLTDNRNGAVAPLFKRLTPYLRYSKSREYVRANSFHAKKKLYGLGSVKAEISAWDVTSSAPELVLAKHCLLDDLESARPLFKTLLTSGGLSSLELTTWPILEPLRAPDVATEALPHS